jgi:hypothetical protein
MAHQFTAALSGIFREQTGCFINFQSLNTTFSCSQVTITGGGSGNPSPKVAFPGYYTGYEPGVSPFQTLCMVCHVTFFLRSLSKSTGQYPQTILNLDLLSGLDESEKQITILTFSVHYLKHTFTFPMKYDSFYFGDRPKILAGGIGEDRR